MGNFDLLSINVVSRILPCKTGTCINEYSDPAILEDAVIYLKVTAIGFICVGMYNGVSSILRALGDTKTPLTFLIVASLINVVLDLLFVLVFKWGVVGVAVATAFAQLISAVACIIYAVKCTTFFRLTKENLKIKKAILYKCLQLGIPVALQNAFDSCFTYCFAGCSKWIWCNIYNSIYGCCKN